MAPYSSYSASDVVCVCMSFIVHDIPNREKYRATWQALKQERDKRRWRNKAL